MNTQTKLSGLQKTMLVLALQNRWGFVTYHDVLMTVWGWMRRNGDSLAKSDMQPDQYNRVHASLSRSARRLAERGLVTRTRRGVTLTDAGRELARTFAKLFTFLTE